MPPVDRFAVDLRSTDSPEAGTDRGVKPRRASSASDRSSISIFVRIFSWPMPRRGSRLTSSTSSSIERFPSPTTKAGTRCAAQMKRPAMTRNRKSWPSRNCSTMTSSRNFRASLNARRSSDSLRMFVSTPRPCDASSGLTTTGQPSFSAISTASSSSCATSPFGTGTPLSPRSFFVRLLSPAISTPSCPVVEAIVAWMRFWWTPVPSITRDRSFSRRCGIPRDAATATIERVEGPSAQRSRVRFSLSIEAPRSRSTSRPAQCSTTSSASLPARTPTRSSSISYTRL